MSEVFGENADNQPKNTVSVYEGDKLRFENYFELKVDAESAASRAFGIIWRAKQTNVYQVLLNGKLYEGAEWKEENL